MQIDRWFAISLSHLTLLLLRLGLSGVGYEEGEKKVPHMPTAEI